MLGFSPLADTSIAGFGNTFVSVLETLLTAPEVTPPEVVWPVEPS